NQNLAGLVKDEEDLVTNPCAQQWSAFEGGVSSESSWLSAGNFWERSKEAANRKIAVDLAKAGKSEMLSDLLNKEGGMPARAYLLPTDEDGQVGPQLTLLAAAQASGNAAVVEVVEEVATRLLFEELHLLVEDRNPPRNIVARCLQAGANPVRPLAEGGPVPLFFLCVLQPREAFHGNARAHAAVAEAAIQLAAAAPLALILVGAHQDETAGELPLAKAAANDAFGHVLVPALCAAVGRLLLRRPAFAAAPPLRLAAEAALVRCPDDPAAKQLWSLLEAAAPCHTAAMRGGRKRPLWEPQVGAADQHCKEAEACAKLSEVEALLEQNRREHAERVAELHRSLSNICVVNYGSLATNNGTSGHPEPDLRGTSEAAECNVTEASGVLQRIRRQRGLDLDYSSVGAAVERLAVDLYASRGHFLLELLQNADDNRHLVLMSYGAKLEAQISLSLGTSEDGSLYFASTNNESGMTSKDVEALCDINRSTKPAQSGKIGRKGVGWKAVFAVSDCPTVLSGDFRFRFDVSRRGQLGYVTPDDLSSQDYADLPATLRAAHEARDAAATVLFLPLRGIAGQAEDDGGTAAASLIRGSVERLLASPAWLLFLRQLRHVTWEDSSSQMTSTPIAMSAERRGDTLVVRQRASGQGESSSPMDSIQELPYLVHRKRASVPESLLPKGSREGAEEEVAIAFLPACSDNAADQSAPEIEAAVFCFLPVRPVGFRFLLHAPWALTSNREDFHLEDPKNCWLRGVAAEALAEAIARFGAELGGQALALLDGRRVLEPFWRRLLEQASLALGDAPIVPLEGAPGVLARPSEVLVPPPSLCRSPGALRFLHAVPAELWLAATGKRLAQLGAPAGEVAAENSRRLLSLRAEQLTSKRLKELLNLPDIGSLIQLQQIPGLAFSPLLDLIGLLLSTAAQPTESDGQERLAGVVEELHQMKVFQLDLGGTSKETDPTEAPRLTSLAEGDIFLPDSSGLWCPELDANTCNLLLAHQGIRVLDCSVWRTLAPSGQTLLRRLGLREATLAEVAAAVVRLHALHLDEATKAESLFETLVRPCAAAALQSQEGVLAVLWAGLEAVRAAREQMLTLSNGNNNNNNINSAATVLPSGPDPALCASPTFRADPAGLRLRAEELGLVLWMPCRSDCGELLLLRRAPATLLPSFLGVPQAAAPLRAKVFQDDEEGEEHSNEVCEASGGGSELLPPPRSTAERCSSRKGALEVALPLHRPGSSDASLRRLLQREAFLADLGSMQPTFERLDLSAVSNRLVSKPFWEALAVFPPCEGQWQIPGKEICAFFRRAAFEPIAGEGALLYVDAPESCEPLLEMLRIPSRANFESLSMALVRWTEKVPAPMCAPKSLLAALLEKARLEQPPPSLLLRLRGLIHVPGRGIMHADQVVWSADDDFSRKVCELGGTPVLKGIYGESLQAWFCDFLTVHESLWCLNILDALKCLVPLSAGGSKNPSGSSNLPAKVSLAFLRRAYTELAEQLEVTESSPKRPRMDQGLTTSRLSGVAQLFRGVRLLILPQPRGRAWKYLKTGDAYWAVAEDLVTLPCSKFSLSSFYGQGESGNDLRRFFVDVLGVTETLTRQDLVDRIRPPPPRRGAVASDVSALASRPPADQRAPSGARADDSDESGDEEDENEDSDEVRAKCWLHIVSFCCCCCCCCCCCSLVLLLLLLLLPLLLLLLLLLLFMLLFGVIAVVVAAVAAIDSKFDLYCTLLMVVVFYVLDLAMITCTCI
ncbi:unnamed protein product, partial [Polarella glacialis]